MFTFEELQEAYSALTRVQTLYLNNGGHFDDPEYVKRDDIRMKFYDEMNKTN